MNTICCHVLIIQSNSGGKFDTLMALVKHNLILSASQGHFHFFELYFLWMYSWVTIGQPDSSNSLLSFKHFWKKIFLIELLYLLHLPLHLPRLPPLFWTLPVLYRVSSPPPYGPWTRYRSDSLSCDRIMKAPALPPHLLLLQLPLLLHRHAAAHPVFGSPQEQYFRVY